MGYFYMNGKQYEILGEINRQQRNKPADLKGISLISAVFILLTHFDFEYHNHV